MPGTAAESQTLDARRSSRRSFSKSLDRKAARIRREHITGSPDPISTTAVPGIRRSLLAFLIGQAKACPTTSDMTSREFMIKLTRLSHEPLVLNSDLIEHLEMTPDTVITLTTGQKLRVNESADEVIARVIEFRRAISRLSLVENGG